MACTTGHQPRLWLAPLTITLMLAGCASFVPTPSPPTAAAPPSPRGLTLAPTPTLLPTSSPTATPVPAVALQLGDTQPLAALALMPTPGMADNKIGTAIGSTYPEFAHDYFIYDRGFRWIHTSFATDPLSWQNVERTTGQYTIDAGADAAITDYAEHGLTIVMSLGAGDWQGRLDVTRFKDPAEIERYGAYVRFMVRHFKDRVAYFELWNEPNDIAVANYVAMARHVIPIIREEAPAAKVAIPASAGHWDNGYPGYGSAGRSVFETDYLFGVLDSDVARLADVISWHPFFATRADDPQYVNYPDLVAQIKARAKASGFHGAYLASEMGWPTIQDPIPGNLSVSALVSTKYLVRTTVLHRGLDIVTVIAPRGGDDQDAIRNTNVLFAGATPVDLPVHVSTNATHLRQYSFALPDSSHLVALWTDWLPVEHDPDVAATVTISGLGGRTAEAIDVVAGSSQRLITSDSGGALVIKGLLVKDYPTFIRIGAPAG